MNPFLLFVKNPSVRLVFSYINDACVNTPISCRGGPMLLTPNIA
jgi:hypothetical protein